MNQSQAMQAYLSQGLFDSSFNAPSALTTGVGRLNGEDAAAFINYVIDQSIIKDAAQNYKMTTPERRVSFIGISNRVLRPGTSGVDPGITAHTTASEAVLRPQLIKAEAVIFDEELEDNIEGDALRADFMGLLTRKIANELEYMFLMGRKTTGTPVTVNQMINGWFVDALTLGHVVDGSTLGDGVAGANTPYITTKKLSKVIKAIPSKYFETPDANRFIISRGVYQDFIDVVGNRATPLGDAAFLAGDQRPLSGGSLSDGRVRGPMGLGWGGFNLFRAPLIPEDMYRAKASGGIATTLASGVAAAATTATLASSVGIAVGEVVKIAGNGGDLAQDETVIVTANNTGTGVINFVNTPLFYAHSSANVAVSGTGDGTFMLMTPFMNLAVGWRRDVQVEWWRNTREGAWYVNVSLRVDALMINPDAAALATNMSVV